MCWVGAGCAAPAPTGALRPDQLELVNVNAEAVTHSGRRAIRLTERPEATSDPDAQFLAILAGSELGAGTIELDIAGTVPPNASQTARGFVGIAFHLHGLGERYQVMYLRPTNARSDDQARRNHTTQYQALPGFPWHRLRAEEPSVYESYVDLIPGEWTRMRIELAANAARLYVGVADQPVLIINDLKTPERTGRVALWIGPESVGYFSGLTIRPDR